MTDHPLTETAAAALRDQAADAHAGDPDATMWDMILHALRAAFDAGREHERANPEDGRPWEPLAEGVPLNVGYEVRQEYNGVTTTGVVGRVDAAGDPWTAEGIFIGVLEYGTWYVRRPARELPTKYGAVIIPNDGHKTITATEPEGGTVWRAREAARTSHDTWLGVWRDEDGAISSVIPAAWIDAPTWQEDDE